MKLLDFRTWMIKQIRDFDRWAMTDMRENPDDWKENMTEADWLEMFNSYMGNNNV